MSDPRAPRPVESDLRFELSEEPPPEDLEALTTGLTAHAAPFVEGPGFVPLSVVARRPDGTLAGGASGRMNWNWLDVSLLWVASELRGRGLGADLLGRLETEAFRRGCRWAHLETFSFQAQPFYERQGYQLFAALDDYPPGYRRLYLKKRLG